MRRVLALRALVSAGMSQRQIAESLVRPADETAEPESVRWARAAPDDGRTDCGRFSSPEVEDGSMPCRTDCWLEASGRGTAMSDEINEVSPLACEGSRAALIPLDDVQPVVAPTAVGS